MRAHLTRPMGDTFHDSVAATVPGMAHFAGTGPCDAVCAECVFWGGKRRRKSHGTLQPARCRKYIQMRKGQGIEIARFGVPSETPACKYFTPIEGDEA